MMISKATNKVVQQGDSNTSEEFLIASVLANRSNGTSEQVEQDKLAKIIAASDGEKQETSTVKKKKRTTRISRRARRANRDARLEAVSSPPDEGDANEGVASSAAQQQHTKSDPDLAIMKAVAARSLEEGTSSSFSSDSGSSSEYEEDLEEDDDEDQPSSQATQFIARYSRNAKKRIEGPLQPGAYEAAPGEKLCRLGTLSYTDINNHRGINKKSAGMLKEEEHPMVARLQRKLTKEREQLECLKASITTLTTPTKLDDEEAAEIAQPDVSLMMEQQQQQALHLASATLIDDFCYGQDGEEASLQHVKEMVKEKYTQLQQMEMELEEMRQQLRDQNRQDTATAATISPPQQQQPAVSLEEEESRRSSAPTTTIQNKALQKPPTMKTKAKTTGTFCNNPSSEATAADADAGYKYDPKMTARENFAMEALLMSGSNHSKTSKSKSSSRRSRSKEKKSLFVASIQRMNINKKSKSRSRSPSTHSNSAKDNNKEKPSKSNRSRSRSQDKKSSNLWMGLFANER